VYRIEITHLEGCLVVIRHIEGRVLRPFELYLIKDVHRVEGLGFFFANENSKRLFIFVLDKRHDSSAYGKGGLRRVDRYEPLLGRDKIVVCDLFLFADDVLIVRFHGCVIYGGCLCIPRVKD